MFASHGSRSGFVPCAGLVACCAFLCAAQVAVEAPTAKLRGVVRDASGTPVAGARVEAWTGRPQAWRESLEKAAPRDDGLERHRTTSDELGRFAFSVRENRSYSVAGRWTDVDGAVQRSTIVEAVSPDSMIKLILEPHSGEALRLRLPPWPPAARRGDVRITVYLGDHFPLPVYSRRFAAGSVFPNEEAVPLPYGSRAGRFMVVLEDDFGIVSWGEGVQSGPRPYFRMSRPQLLSLAIKVVDDKGAAVAGAVLESFSIRGGGAYVAGQTNARGEAKVDFPFNADATFVLRARKAGLQEAWVARILKRYFVGDEQIDDLPRQVEVRLERAPRGSWRVLGFDGQPLANCLVELRRQPVFGKVSHPHVFVEDHATSDENGALDFGHVRVSGFHQSSISVVLAERQRDEVAAHLDGFPLPYTDLSVWKDASNVIDLSKLAVHRFEVVLPDGRAARDAVCVRESGSDWPHDIQRAFECSPYRTNRRGRLTMLAAPSERFHFMVPGQGWALTPEVAASAKAKRPVTVQLEPFVQRCFHVVDDKGQPCAGASARVVSSRSSGSSSRSRFAQRINRIGLTSTCDANGLVKLWWVDDPGLDYHLQFTIQARRTRLHLEPSKPNEAAVTTVVLGS